MKQIYVLSVYGGSYEDAWKSSIKASFDQQKLLNEASELTEALKVLDEKSDKYYDSMRQWCKDNQAPATPLPKDIVGLHVIPRWDPIPGVKQIITDEMRADRARLQAENQQITETQLTPFYEAHAKWEALMNDAMNALTAEMGTTVEEMKKHSSRETRGYEVNSIDFEE